MSIIEEDINIDKNKHYLIIGKNGETINLLKQQCGSNFFISIPHKNENINTIKLKGSLQQIQIAKDFINNILNNSNNSNIKFSLTNLISKELSIPKEYHCAIIGENGKNINDIKLKSKIHSIFIPSINDNSSTITIYSSSSSYITKAIKLINIYIENYKEKTIQTDNLYKKYNKLAQQHAENRNKYYEQASLAYKTGKKAKAKELSLKGKQEHHKMLKAQHFAAFKIFKEKNKDSLSKGNMDLHGLQVKQAIGIVNIYLYKFKKKNYSSINIICGKGLHSDGNAVIKPAITKLLNEQSLVYTENDGTFTISL